MISEPRSALPEPHWHSLITVSSILGKLLVHSRLLLALHEQLTLLGFYLTRTGAISVSCSAWPLPDPPH